MHVLLIGKYPPCQGGIASTAFWLAHTLKKRQGMTWSVVTCRPENYSSEPCIEDPALQVKIVGEQNSRPWFIPGDDLLIAQLASAGLELAKKNRPDVVEANYLAPFAIAGWMVAKALDRPFVIRPAASDIAKLLVWEPITPMLRHILNEADLLVLSENKASALAAHAIAGKRVLRMERYVPDGTIFSPNVAPPSPQPTLLAATKVPFLWRNKGVDAACHALFATKDWSLTLLADGHYRGRLLEEVHAILPASRVAARHFIAPDEMPIAIANSWAVWAATKTEGVEDFPNLAWEAAKCGRICFLAEHQRATTQLEGIPSLFLRFIDPDQPDSIAAELRTIPLPDTFATKVPVSDESHAAWCDKLAFAYRELVLVP